MMVMRVYLVRVCVLEKRRKCRREGCTSMDSTKDKSTAMIRFNEQGEANNSAIYICALSAIHG